MEQDQQKSNALNKNDSNLKVASYKDRRKALGKALKTLREESMRSKQDVIHLTRISPPFIEALENGDFDLLPGEVFGRGFIKNICQVLDAAPNDFLAEYDLCWEKKLVKTKSYRSKAPVQKRKLKFEKANKKNLTQFFSTRAIFWWMLFPAICVVLVSVSLFYFKKNEPTKPASTMEPVKIDQAQQSHENDSEPVVNTEPVEQPAKVLESTDKLAAQEFSDKVIAQGYSVVRVKVRKSVEIRSKLDDKASVTKNYEPDVYKFKLFDSAEIFIGDMSSVDLAFNGKDIEVFGSNKGGKRFKFFNKDPDKKVIL